MTTGIDSWGRPLPATEERPTVNLTDGLDKMRAAILTLMRAKRATIIGGGNHIALTLIRPHVVASDVHAEHAAFMAGVWSLVTDGIIVPGHGQALAVTAGEEGYA